jgi:hypothetical protein
VAQITRPRLSVTVTGNRARVRVSVRVVLETEDEVATVCRNGCLRVICEIREWDRVDTAWLRPPLVVFEPVLLHGRDFEGGLVHEVIFQRIVSRNSLREDLHTRDEMRAHAFLHDVRGRRPTLMDLGVSDMLRLES